LSTVDARYIVQGDIAAIQSVTIYNKSFKKGDNIALVLNYSGTPFDIITGENPINASYDTRVNLLDDQNQTIASWSGLIDYNATSTKTIALVAERSANGYTVDVTATKAGKVVTHYNVKVGPNVGSGLPNWSIYDMWIDYVVALPFILLFALLAVVAIRNKKHRTLCIAIIILGLALTFLALTKIQQASAISGPKPVYVSEVRRISAASKRIYATTFNGPTGSILQPGETFYVTGVTTSWQCGNKPSNMQFLMTFEGVTKFLLLANTNGKTQFSGGPFVAPATPGVYRLTIKQSFQLNTWPLPTSFTESRFNYLQGYMDFTVPCPNGADNPPVCGSVDTTPTTTPTTTPPVISTTTPSEPGLPSSTPPVTPTTPVVIGECSPFVSSATGLVPATSANVNQRVTWIASSTGSVSWGGDGVAGSPTGSRLVMQYSTIGNKHMSITVGSSTPVSCTSPIDGLPNGLPITNNPNFHEF
jgi:hypothetical protein